MIIGPAGFMHTQEASTRRKVNVREIPTFVAYLRNRFIPDLRASGRQYTANDLSRLARILVAGRLTKNGAEFVRYLESTLIPDLRISGDDMTAEDFEEGIDLLRAKMKKSRRRV